MPFYNSRIIFICYIICLIVAYLIALEYLEYEDIKCYLAIPFYSYLPKQYLAYLFRVTDFIILLPIAVTYFAALLVFYFVYPFMNPKEIERRNYVQRDQNFIKKYVK